MGSVAHYIEVEADAQTCYAWWRGLTRLPEIFPDVKSVEPVNGDPRLTRWEVSGPLGTTVSWDAKIVEDIPGEKIAWTSIPSEEGGTHVANSGAVRFDDHGARCGIEVALEYTPPAGGLGEAVAKLLSDPQTKVERALEAFREQIAQVGGTSAAATYPSETPTWQPAARDAG